jgi:conjugal transfer pilus assembly protein TraB
MGTDKTPKSSLSKNNPEAGGKTVAIDQKILEKTMVTQSAQQAKDLEEMKKEIELLRKGGTPQTGASGPGVPQPGTALPGVPPSPTQKGAGPTDAGSMLVGGALKSTGMVANPTLPEPKAGQDLPTLPPLPSPAATGSKGAKAKKQLPPPPPLPNNMSAPGHGGETAQHPSGMTAPIETFGDIEIVSNSPAKDSKNAKAVEDKKKEKRGVYLPPSFMEATLISGLNAPTAEGARGNPVPVLIRIKDLAILPNQVKSNLKGCFVIAEGVGNLADERAHLRLVSLSCISKGGEAVIDSKIKGFAVDADGKLGLSGNVVSKMGAVLARTLISGFFGGIGDAMKSAGQTTNTSAIGTTTTASLDAATIAVAGVGSGVSSAAKELQRFYLDLAKQTMPVVEVGATKKITLVIQEGVNLEIKNVKTVPRY